jgi:hypothetical protein
MLAVLVSVTLTGGLAACSDSPGGVRPLKDGELQRLSMMRLKNHGAGSVAINGQIGDGARATNINGWVDWRRSLIYLSAWSATSSALVQARPGVIAIRPGDPAKPLNGEPPLEPPTGGWRIRPISLTGEDKAPLDNLIAFLFLLANSQQDKTELLKPLKNQWVRVDNANGTEVDVLLGPAVLPLNAPSPTPSPAPPQAPAPEPTPDPSASPSPSQAPLDPLSLEANGGAVGYWLDADGGLHKVETFLGNNLPTIINFGQSSTATATDAATDAATDPAADSAAAPAAFVAVDGLGGRDLAPAKVTDAEATLISAMRQRDFQAKGAEITITLPVLPGALRQAKGWLDWQRGLAYLSVQDVDDPSYDVLLHATKTTVSLQRLGARGPELPPVPAPKGNWEKAQWAELSGSVNLTDLDLLIYEALGAGVNKLDDAARIKEGAQRLRFDAINGVAMGVFELENVPSGQARLRYWLDNTGVLRRLEIWTATGGLAQLDLTYGAALPNLPATVS